MELGSVFEFTAVDFFIILGLTYFVYWMFFKKSVNERKPENKLPELKKDLTLDELREYDGVKNERVFLALFGNIYDVTQGKSFYGPGGPYHSLAGHDATRGLATFNVSAVSDVEDDISDLSPSEISDARDWESKFKCKYPFVGRVLKAEKNDEKKDS
uniref:Cytochrome b5 heme-binding domain-containing protein n=1 Tax=Syphacia muris TaxID=451379 RepID=A0A0N5AEI9_9BILA